VKKHQAFTLIETMIVAAIISILVAIALPIFSERTKKSHDISALSDAKTSINIIIAAKK